MCAKENNVEKVRLLVTDAPDIEFNGHLVAKIYENVGTGRDEDLRIYKSVAGKYICWRGNISNWENVSDKYEYVVCSDESEIIDYFGHDENAKYLYRKAGISDVEFIA